MADSENHIDGRRDHWSYQQSGFYSSSGIPIASTSREPIGLDSPRPGELRSRNEYVDVTKLPAQVRRHKKPQRTAVSIPVQRPMSTNGLQIRRDPISATGSGDNRVLRLDTPTKARNGDSAILPGRVVRVVATSNAVNGRDASTYSVITQQPKNTCSRTDSAPDCSMDKRKPTPSSTSSLLDSSTSIICKRCGRCRCAACARPRQLPSRWICGNHCLLSSESMVDAVSCMCCVKACLYHVSGHVYDDSHTDDYYEDGVVCDCDSSCSSLALGRGICGSHSLWSCSPKSPDRCFRWTVLSSAMICLPCMWFYVPLKTCAAGVEAAYVKCCDNGCHCDRQSSANGRLLNRRLRNRRSHTLPPELPSIAAAKKAAGVSSSDSKPVGSKKAGRRYSAVEDETT